MRRLWSLDLKVSFRLARRISLLCRRRKRRLITSDLINAKDMLGNSVETENSSALPTIDVGLTKVTDKANPITLCKIAAGAAGELGLGKLAIVCLTTKSSFEIVIMLGVTHPLNCVDLECSDASSSLGEDSCCTCGLEVVTAP